MTSWGPMTTAEDLRHVPGSEGFRRLNLAMGAAGLAAFGMLYATQPLLPELGADFGVGPTASALTISVATGALALLVVPVTAVARRVGRARTMVVALLAATVLTLLAALAPTYAALVVLRGLSGAALAAVVAVAMGHVAAEVHPRGLGTAMGLYVAGNSLGGVGGRVITSAVVDVASWRWAVGVLGLAALAATVVFWRLLPAPVSSGPAAAAAATAAGAADAAEPPPVRGRAVRVLLRDPAVLGVLLVPFVLMGGFVATYNYLTYRLAEAPFSLPAAVVGLVFLAYLAGSASSALAGRLVDRFGRPPVLLTSIVVMGAGLALTLPDQLAAVVVGLVVLTGGFFAAHSAASGWAPVVGGRLDPADDRLPGQASALYVFGYYAGSSVFGAALGTAWYAGGWSATAAGVGVLALLGLLGALSTTVLLRRSGGLG